MDRLLLLTLIALLTTAPHLLRTAQTQQSQPCKDPPAQHPLPPWINDRTCGSSKSVGPRLTHKKLNEQNHPLPPGQVLCIAEYSVCRDREVDEILPVIKRVTIDLASWNSRNFNDYNRAASAACRMFFDEHRNAPARTVCCDNWSQSAANPQFPECDPRTDPDCDGIPNSEDPFPLHARSTEFTSGLPPTRFPFWKDLNNATPVEYCECQWELLDTRYQCTNVRTQSADRRGSAKQAQYKYQARWKCPVTGREFSTNREVNMPGVSCPRSRMK